MAAARAARWLVVVGFVGGRECRQTGLVVADGRLRQGVVLLAQRGCHRLESISFRGSRPHGLTLAHHKAPEREDPRSTPFGRLPAQSAPLEEIGALRLSAPCCSATCSPDFAASVCAAERLW